MQTEKIKILIESHGHNFVGYIPRNKKEKTKQFVIFDCKCGRSNSFKKDLGAFKKHPYCCLCGKDYVINNFVKLQDDEIERHFVDSGCKLIKSYMHDFGGYKKVVVEYICSCGNESKKMLGNFLKAKQCQSCGNKKKGAVAGTEETKKKRAETNITLYGFECQFSDPATIEKIKQTNVKNLGVENPFSSPEIQEKIKETNIKNLGVENPFSSPEIQEKIKQTNVKNLGVENPLSSPEIQEKIKETNVKNLGVEYPMQNELVKKKAAETWDSKTPEEREEIANKIREAREAKTPEEVEEIVSKFIKTSLTNWGFDHPMQNELVKKKGMATKLKNHGTVHPHIHFGKTQKEIQDFLNSFGCDFVENDYSILEGKEIDLYDCNKNIAIEYCGLFWHTDSSWNPRDKNYHHNKYIKCLKKGVNLITIFEDEWINRKSQCKNVLKSILGIYDLRVYARKCTIVKLNKQEFNDFCDEYHLQGKNTLGQIFYGLKYENTLVAAMSFGRHHINNHDLVLDRFCCKGDVQVVGGASRLFKACLTEAKALGFQKVISWSDNRWRQGNVYEKLGFTLEKELDPDYSYVYLKNPKNKRISNLSMAKKSMNRPPDMTEKAWTILNGFGRIYDCGKKRWVYNIA